MAYKLIGQNFEPHDVVAKVTGRAKYAEDFRAEGMVFCKLLTSPMPHARIRNIDASEALKMPGVLGILTADDVPQFPPPQRPILQKDEVFFIGDPILALAAVDETTAADALEKIKIDFEQLPHVLDPLDSLYPGGPNARSNGNVAAAQINLQTVKWQAGDFGDDKQAADGQARRDLELRRSRCRLQGIEAGDRGELRHRRLLASQHGAAHRHGVLAGRQVLPVRLQPEPHRGGAEHRALHRHRAEGPGVHRRVLRRRLRQQDPRLSDHGDPGAAVEEAQPSGDDAHHAHRGILDRHRAPDLPGPCQAGLPRGRQAARRRSLRRAGERARYRRRRFPLRRQRAVVRLSADRDALPGDPGADQHAAARTAARAGREPAGAGDRADDRQGGA